jgi:hypothetical protein
MTAFEKLVYNYFSNCDKIQARLFFMEFLRFNSEYSIQLFYDAIEKYFPNYINLLNTIILLK